jgi:aryl-alcohol dehydrogenase-like predicted oxidoreductase
MRTTLGSTGSDVGVIGLGCMGMTYRYDMTRAIKALRP